MATCTDGSWNDFTSFSPSSQWLSQEQHSEWKLFTVSDALWVSLSSLFLLKSDRSKWQIKHILFHQQATGHRILSLNLWLCDMGGHSRTWQFIMLHSLSGEFLAVYILKRVCDIKHWNVSGFMMNTEIKNIGSEVRQCGIGSSHCSFLALQT